MFKPYKIAYQLQHVKVREAKRFGLLRESVAHLLSEAARTIPHAAMIMQIDVTSLVEYAKDSDSDLAAVPGESQEKRLFRRAFLVKTRISCATVSRSLWCGLRIMGRTTPVGVLTVKLTLISSA